MSAASSAALDDKISTTRQNVQQKLLSGGINSVKATNYVKKGRAGGSRTTHGVNYVNSKHDCVAAASPNLEGGVLKCSVVGTDDVAEIMKKKVLREGHSTEGCSSDAVEQKIELPDG